MKMIEERSTRAEQLAQNPSANGFWMQGYSVRLADGRYVRELRVLNPESGVVATSDGSEAATYEKRSTAEWLATRTGGEVAEHWLSEAEHLMRWGCFITGPLPDSPPPRAA